MKIVKRLGVIFGFVLFVACNQKAEPEEYLIPSGFAGKVNILFGRKDGAAKAYEDGRRVYKIGTVRWLVDDTTRKGIFLDGTSGQYGSDGDARAVQFDEFVVSSKEMLDSFFKKEYLRAFDDRIEKVTGLRFN